MEFTELVSRLCLRPGLWVLPPYFSTVCAFIRGYDHARDGGPLAGFREWLVVRADRGDNLTWEGLVKILILPGHDLTEPLTADREESCLKALASLFEEFFRFREEQGITRVHYDYARWLLRKRWYMGPLRKKREDSV
jgi:hypothetical protein